MTLRAYYHGRLAWSSVGSEWPEGVELEPVSAGWWYQFEHGDPEPGLTENVR